jgi:hypothetical protein
MTNDLETRKAKIASDYRKNLQKLATSSIKDCLREVYGEYQDLALIEFAAESMSCLASMFEEDYEIELVFQQCKAATLRGLKERTDRWESAFAALEI